MVVGGYGWVGRGIAMRAAGMGGNVIVVEVDPIRALEAAMDGFRVMHRGRGRARSATSSSPRPATSTSGARDHFPRMRDGAILANSGHFNDEIELPALEAAGGLVRARSARSPASTPMADGRRIYLLADGRLVNLGARRGTRRW